jgi:5,5'-dehydrodivanillate O-demethylase
MLTKDENERLCEVDRGTPMGELLRRYWWPVLGVDELTREGIMAVRILGEDLVAYRDLSGSYGLVGRHCAHRRADLTFGILEKDGLRCSYHGWCFDRGGRCTDQPYEQTANPRSKFSERASIDAYLLRERAGILWAYLGPRPAPVLWNWEPYAREHCFRQIVISEVPCNWLQAQENSIDPVHFEWLHDNWTAARAGRSTRAPKHVKLGFDEFEHGFTYRRVREGGSEDDDLWTVGSVCGPTPSSPPTISNGAHRSTTRTCSASPWPSTEYRRIASRSTKTSCRRGEAPSVMLTAGGSCRTS